MSTIRPARRHKDAGFPRPALLSSFLTCIFVAAACAAPSDQAPEETATADQADTQPPEPDHFVPSTPDNLSWGWYPIDKDPVLRMQSGETVRVNTLTHVGAGQSEEPVAYLTGLGIPREEILDDVLDFWATREGRPREGRSGHVITGPIHVEGAEPGDVLEIEILSIETASRGRKQHQRPRGVFSTQYPGFAEGDPGAGHPAGHPPLIRTGESMAPKSHSPDDPSRCRTPGSCNPGRSARSGGPASPGVPSGSAGVRPPGPFGGNLDVKDLTAGTTVYLPVFHPGALFYVGDPHGAQGDGEVSGTAIEQSLTGTFRLTVHKDRTITGPRAENGDHYILMGIDLDLDRATRQAVWEVVDFLVEEKGLTPAKALSLASIAVDFRVSEVVDLTQVVSGFIPKDVFLR